MSFSVEFTELALADVEVADAWWRLNRPSAPDAVANELARVILLLSEYPHAGVVVPGTRVKDTRRVTLRQLDYVSSIESPRIAWRILRLWHGRRRARPRL